MAVKGGEDGKNMERVKIKPHYTSYCQNCGNDSIVVVDTTNLCNDCAWKLIEELEDILKGKKK